MGISQSIGLRAGIGVSTILLSGIWLKRSGKPYTTIIFTIHKLVALAAVVGLVTAIIRTHRETPFGTTELIPVVVTGVLSVATIVSGGLVSIDKPTSAVFGVLHRVTPYLTVLSTAAMLYMLQ